MKSECYESSVSTVGCIVADPDQVSGIQCFLDPVIRDVKKPGSGIWVNIADHISESLVTIFCAKKYLNALSIADSDPGSGVLLPMDVVSG